MSDSDGIYTEERRDDTEVVRIGSRNEIAGLTQADLIDAGFWFDDKDNNWTICRAHVGKACVKLMSDHGVAGTTLAARLERFIRYGECSNDEMSELAEHFNHARGEARADDGRTQ
jgi:hypothetical protein